MMEDKKNDHSSGSLDEGTPPELCSYCHDAPCKLEQTYTSDESLYTVLMREGDEMMSSGMANNQIRYSLYRTAALYCFGNLGAGNRRQLPQCIVSEIRDAFPAQSETNYVGYKEA